MVLKVTDTTFLEEYTFMLPINMGTGGLGAEFKGRGPEAGKSNSLRREICQFIYRYAEANNKYIKDYDKNKK